MFLKNKFIQITWFVLLILTPIVLWILPADLFDESKVIVCPSRLFFDIECFGCGMTRAVMHFHHLEIEEAIYYNTGVLAIFPALVVIWFYWVYKAAGRIGLLEKLGLKKRGI